MYQFNQANIADICISNVRVLSIRSKHCHGGRENWTEIRYRNPGWRKVDEASCQPLWASWQEGHM